MKNIIKPIFVTEIVKILSALTELALPFSCYKLPGTAVGQMSFVGRLQDLSGITCRSMKSFVICTSWARPTIIGLHG